MFLNGNFISMRVGIKYLKSQYIFCQIIHFKFQSFQLLNKFCSFCRFFQFEHRFNACVRGFQRVCLDLITNFRGIEITVRNGWLSLYYIINTISFSTLTFTKLFVYNYKSNKFKLSMNL